MKNTFGNSVSITLFGESHGAQIGAVLDGLAPGIPVEEGREAIPVNELVKVKITDIRDDFLTGSVLLDG